MSVNSSVWSNDSHLLSSIKTPFGLDCLFDSPSCLVFTIYTVSSILLFVPLCVLVLYFGLQRWRQQCSSFPAAVTSHSDCFTYHTVIVELINLFGSVLCCCGIYKKYYFLLMVWYYLLFFTWYAETSFHVLTCVEHYLAVVHPIIYLSLRKQRGVTIRNITIGCIWLFCLGITSFMTIDVLISVMEVCVLFTSFFIIFFCSLSVLYVLIRPGPGEQGRDREKVDPSKQRAFYNIMAILGVLLLRCVWSMVWDLNNLLKANIKICVLITCAIWLSLPSSLVLPLLFLHRAGTLVGCRNNSK